MRFVPFYLLSAHLVAILAESNPAKKIETGIDSAQNSTQDEAVDYGEFERACSFIRDQQVKPDDKLKLYGYFKCATVGICNTSCPSVFLVRY